MCCTGYLTLGRRGVWQWEGCKGNPCNRMDLRTYKGGYANELQETVCNSKAAKPMTAAAKL
jgi:hypothetical protein